MTHIDNVVSYMLAQRGKPYWNRDDRRFGQSMLDCSGIHVAAWRACRVWYPAWATWSGAQLRWGIEQGTTITPAEARRTYGAVCVRGGLGGAGNAGHIVTSLGDGRTMEAMGTAYGCRIGAFDGRGFADCFRIPGVQYRDGTQPGPAIDWALMKLLAEMEADEMGRPNRFVTEGPNQPWYFYDGHTKDFVNTQKANLLLDLGLVKRSNPQVAVIGKETIESIPDFKI